MSGVAFHKKIINALRVCLIRSGPAAAARRPLFNISGSSPAAFTPDRRYYSGGFYDQTTGGSPAGYDQTSGSGGSSDGSSPAKTAANNRRQQRQKSPAKQAKNEL